MVDFEVIGVPFDGYGRPGNQARAAGALRTAGLVAALGDGTLDGGDVPLPPPDPGRGPDTSLLNEPGLIAMTDGLRQRVGGALAAGRFPVVVGGDCSALLGTVAGLRAVVPTAGLVFVDGHEDTMPLDVSEDGEAANTEIGLLLGLTGRLLRGPLAGALPVLGTDELAVLGPRDAAWRARFNVGSLREHGVWLRSLDELVTDPAGQARTAVAHLDGPSRSWWLHVDLDVLDPVDFPAQGLPGFDDIPGGLSWAQLTDLLRVAVRTGGCLGWSLVIYDPDQDQDGSAARRIIELVGAVTGEIRAVSDDGRTATPG
jgi:arginase